MIGPMWAFFAAGARSMVVSQFRVESKSATAEMAAFHTRLAAQKEPTRGDCSTGFLAAFSMAAALAALPVQATAQVATGNIRGVVVDSTEAVIPSAKVTLTNSGTGLQHIVTTNESGDFNAPFMPLGDYQLAAEVAGFSKKVLTGINLQVDQTATIRIVLEPGTASEYCDRPLRHCAHTRFPR